MKKQSSHMAQRCLDVVVGLGMSGAIGLFTPPAVTQSVIVPDNTLGTENSQIIQTFNGQPIEVIINGARRGQNLFHSFQEFNVTQGRSAYFFSPDASIQNVLARITGNNPSNIDGRLGTFLVVGGQFVPSRANLFLMNPNGIIFGAGASLDLGGSFVATTANAMQFGDRGFFSTSDPAASSLLTVNPSAFLFNQLNQGQIVNRSTTPLGAPGGFDLYGLQVPIGQSIVLVGGDVRLESGGINAPGGRVELGGLAASGSIGLEFQTDDLRLTFPSESTRADVALTDVALVSVASAGGGSVAINARNLDIVGNSLIRGGIETGAIATRPAGDIVVNVADSVRLDGENTEINNNIRPNSVGNAGAIVINTGALSLTNGAFLRSVILGQGNSSNVVIHARESVLFDSSQILTGAESDGTGNSGSVQITAGSLTLSNGARFNTSRGGQGNGGAITIQATGAVTLSGSDEDTKSAFLSGIGQNGVGNGGDILITAESLALRNGLLNASVSGTDKNGKGLAGRGNAGNITLNIRGAVAIDGFASGVASFLGFTATGNAGQITLNAEALALTNGATINNNAFGRGNANNITIQVADGITLDNKSQISNNVLTPPGLTTAVGNSGELRIRAKTLTATDSSIDSQNNGEGDAGNLFIMVDTLQLHRATITASKDNGGKAGNIQIDARDAVTLQGKSANIQSVLFSGIGQGGDITINTGTLSLIDALGISTVTNAQGPGGDITLNVRDRLLVDNSLIFSSASSAAQGSGGDIHINANSIFVINGGLNAATAGSGNAGNIVLSLRDLLHVNNGTISTAADQASGGGIDITARQIRLQGNSDITTFVGSGVGGGGNITLTAKSIIALNDSDILSFAKDGKGGNITFNTRAFFGQNYRPGSPAPFDGNNRVDVNASGAVSGIITLPDVSFLQNGLTDFPQTFTDTTQLLANSCIVRSAKQNGRFTITGSGGLPQRPGDAPLSPFPTGEVRSVRGEEGQGKRGEQGESYVIQNSSLKTQNSPDRPWKLGDPIVEPQGVYQLANGELVMSRECAAP